MYPYSHLGQTIPGGHGYTALQGYAMPGHQIVQFGGPSVNTMTTSSLPTIQAPYPTGKFPLTQLLFYSPQLMCFFFCLCLSFCVFILWWDATYDLYVVDDGILSCELSCSITSRGFLSVY